MPEIYALTDPTGEIRYIGKANNSRARFKGHLRDAKRRKTPVYAWIRKLEKIGQRPGLTVLEICDDWQSAEQRLIADHRAAGARLLNVADGGDEPFCSCEQRRTLGRKTGPGNMKKITTERYARLEAGRIMIAEDHGIFLPPMKIADPDVMRRALEIVAKPLSVTW